MPRRKSLFSGPKRRSVKLGPIKQNYKGFIPTSTSVGSENFRVNVGGRGTRTTSRIPGTNIRTHGYFGKGRGQAASRASPQIQQESSKKKGCLRGCSPLILVLLIGVVLLILVAT